MGYTTDFSGRVEITPPLSLAETSFLNDLNQTRRMNRHRGPLFVKASGYAGQDHEPDIIDYNSFHPDQPGLWCQWVPTADGTALEWDGGEKFYHAAEWMKYIVTCLLAPGARRYLDAHLDEDPRLALFTADHRVDGAIEAQGEELEDAWRLVVADSVVMVAPAEFNPTELEAALDSDDSYGVVLSRSYGTPVVV